MRNQGRPSIIGNQEALARAAEVVGGFVKLAQMMEIAPSSVYMWVNRGRVPAERVIAIERLTGVPRHELRPDIYPPEEYRRTT